VLFKRSTTFKKVLMTVFLKKKNWAKKSLNVK